MSKLEELLNNLYVNISLINNETIRDKSFEDLEIIRKLLYNLTSERAIIEKRLKALEIIKKKKVNVGSFMECCLSLSYEDYIKQWGNWHKHIFKNISGEVLTQEEFNLLKEVLEND